MKFSIMVATIAVATGIAFPGVASAAVYSLAATGPEIVISATVTTGAANSGGFNVTAITGSFDGIAVTGLSTFFSADNILFPSSTSFNGSGLVDGDGLSFGLSTGDTDNIFASSQGSGAPTLYAIVGSNVAEQTAITLTVAPVTTTPEPASMAIVGAGLIGLAATRRKRQ